MIVDLLGDDCWWLLIYDSDSDSDFEDIQASGSVFVHICVLHGLTFVNFQIMTAIVLSTCSFCFTFLVIADIVPKFLSQIRIL